MSSAETRPGPSLWWVLPPAFLLVLFIIAAVYVQPPTNLDPGSSYNSGKDGTLAAFLLLDELGYPVFRSRRLAEGNVRWLLHPTADERAARRFDTWIREGGRVLLADGEGLFTRDLGLPVSVHRGDEHEGRLGGNLHGRLAGGEARVEIDRPGIRVWAWVEGEPFVSIHTQGRGEIWLVHRPDFVRNGVIGKADNGVALCRIAEAMLAGRADRLALDEFFHGLRERPGVLALLFSRPTVWVTVQGLLALALVLWRNLPRFGPLRQELPARRRSREEYVDALAALLERKGDVADAYARVRDDFLRELERDLGLPGGSDPAEVARRAASARATSEERLLRLLTARDLPAGPGPKSKALVRALNELETLRDEYFATRPTR